MKALNEKLKPLFARIFPEGDGILELLDAWSPFRMDSLPLVIRRTQPQTNGRSAKPYLPRNLQKRSQESRGTPFLPLFFFFVDATYGDKTIFILVASKIKVVAAKELAKEKVIDLHSRLHTSKLKSNSSFLSCTVFQALPLPQT